MADPSTQEAEVLALSGCSQPELHSEFQTSLGYKVTSCLQKCNEKWGGSMEEEETLERAATHTFIVPCPFLKSSGLYVDS